MRKVLSIIAICAFALSIQAQNKDYRHVLSVTAGANIFKASANGVIDSVLSKNSDPSKLSLKSTPTLQFSYDFGLGKVVSFGLAGNFNQVAVDAQDFKWTDSAGKPSVANYNVKINRMSVGVRMLFHYGNSGRLDMYSGLRFGISKWSNSVTSNNPKFNFEDVVGTNEVANRDILGLLTGTLPQLQVIPFGLRGYITDNIGLGFETAIGSPYYASLSLNYRIGGGK
jgi:hypothetical protein